MVKDYEKMSLKELKLIALSKNIDCKETKEEIISNLKKFDLGKYVFPTIHEKNGKEYTIGISLNNTDHLLQIGKLVEKGEAVSLKRYSNDRIYYQSTQKLI